MRGCILKFTLGVIFDTRSPHTVPALVQDERCGRIGPHAYGGLGSPALWGAGANHIP